MRKIKIVFFVITIMFIIVINKDLLATNLTNKFAAKNKEVITVSPNNSNMIKSNKENDNAKMYDLYARFITTVVTILFFLLGYAIFKGNKEIEEAKKEMEKLIEEKNKVIENNQKYEENIKNNIEIIEKKTKEYDEKISESIKKYEEKIEKMVNGAFLQEKNDKNKKELMEMLQTTEEAIAKKEDIYIKLGEIVKYPNIFNLEIYLKLMDIFPEDLDIMEVVKVGLKYVYEENKVNKINI